MDKPLHREIPSPPHGTDAIPNQRPNWDSDLVQLQFLTPGKEQIKEIALLFTGLKPTNF